MDYTIYITNTGLITGEGTSQGLTSVDQIILEEGESIIEGSYDRMKYKILEGVATEYTPETLPIIRNERDGLLRESDWTQVTDSPLSDSKKAEWATYRQALRDLPSTDPIVWPTEPS